MNVEAKKEIRIAVIFSGMTGNIIEWDRMTCVLMLISAQFI